MASKAAESNGQPCSTQRQLHPSCVRAVQRGLDKELWDVCDAACQHVMTKHSSAFRPSQPWCAPLNFSLSAHSFPLHPLFRSASPLPHGTFYSPPPPPPFSFSFSSSCQAIVLLCCSDTFLKHAAEREKGKIEGERMERRRKRKGKIRD